MKAVITGMGGFVGHYLELELADSGYLVSGADILSTNPNIHVVDLLNRVAVDSFISTQKPDKIFHLAAQASVSASWSNPQGTFLVNVIGTLNLLDAVRRYCIDSRIVIVGTSDQYGLVRPEDCPISESYPINPVSPYAISKQTQENLVNTYIKAYGMDIVMTRSFNHFGPGQRKGFVVSDFASAIVQIEQGAIPVLSVGNLDAVRDFTDVRDVVRAYRLLGEMGKTGEIYNVGSGIAHSIRDVLNEMMRHALLPIEVRQDPAKMRPSDLPIIQCDNTKLRSQTGWAPIISFPESIRDTLQSWRNGPITP